MQHLHICISVQKTDDWQRNKYTHYACAGGTFFQLCCCVSFLVVVEIVLGDTYLPYQLCRCVFFFVAAGNSFRLHRSAFWVWRFLVLCVTSYLLQCPVQLSPVKTGGYIPRTAGYIPWTTGNTRFAWAGGTCPRFAWAGGTFFPVVLLCQFLVLAGNGFWLYILLCTWNTIQLWCCVSFFGSGGK